MYVIADRLGLEGGDPPSPLQRPAAEVTARVEAALDRLAALRTRASLSFRDQPGTVSARATSEAARVSMTIPTKASSTRHAAGRANSGRSSRAP